MQSVVHAAHAAPKEELRMTKLGNSAAEVLSSSMLSLIDMLLLFQIIIITRWREAMGESQNHVRVEG